jgi:hypothetical protein
VCAGDQRATYAAPSWHSDLASAHGDGFCANSHDRRSWDREGTARCAKRNAARHALFERDEIDRRGGPSAVPS